MIDKGLSKYDPHKIAEQKSQAIVHYREARRLFKKLTRIKEEKEKARYLHYRFLTNEKHSVEDAKAKARIDPEAAEELMDKMFAELDRVVTKIELMTDANATARAEMKLGGFTP